jgi:hypothetical protein
MDRNSAQSCSIIFCRDPKFISVEKKPVWAVTRQIRTSPFSGICDTDRKAGIMTKNGATLVLADAQGPRISDLVELLNRYFFHVEVAPNPAEDGSLIRALNPVAFVFTDTIVCPSDVPMRMRRLLPKAGFLALYDQITPATERSLRAAGTIFLGSYETFFAFSQGILRPVLETDPARNILERPVIFGGALRPKTVRNRGVAGPIPLTKGGPTGGEQSNPGGG